MAEGQEQSLHALLAALESMASSLWQLVKQ